MLTIRDDEESPLVTLVLTDTEIQEVDDADTPDVEENKTTITASLSHPSSAATTVTIAPIEDVLTVSGPLTIPAGQTRSSAPATLTALDNSVPAVNAMVTVSATAVNEVGVTGPADVTLTIVDDEAPRAGTLRLVDGEVEHEGRLEMYYDGQWGTICNDYWTNEDADVACKQLGYSEGSEGNASIAIARGISGWVRDRFISTTCCARATRRASSCALAWTTSRWAATTAGTARTSACGVRPAARGYRARRR